ncbi:hypothetical protein LRF89_06590 [Halorhodospira sp. 9621]|uniref:hypothetical protein n=1 Tax=unclassified Halorhodospira TaxID=2626748 RepID=UPI001EE95C61|nr:MULTISPECIES: hypothetical protein [unclassified Halorhodospira]MCG5533108.1 hypothetical protein [Halorhodospira sp. 9621]MCG5537863.1 hypothetical protein [Halorhodospira sp. 9622]
MKVKYIGREPTHRDRLYGSGVFWSGPGDVQEVEEEIAERMLKRHPDQYALISGVTDAGQKPAQEPESGEEDGGGEEDLMVEVRGEFYPLRKLSRDVLAEYAEQRHGVKLDKRRSAQSLAEEIRRLETEG